LNKVEENLHFETHGVAKVTVLEKESMWEVGKNAYVVCPNLIDQRGLSFF